MSTPQPLQPSHAVTLKIVPFVDLPKLPFPPAQWQLPPRPAQVLRPVTMQMPACATVVATTPALEPQLAWIPCTILSILKAVKNLIQHLQQQLHKYRTRDPFNMWKKPAVLSWLYSSCFLTPSIGLGCSEMKILIMRNSPLHNNNKSNYKSESYFDGRASEVKVGRSAIINVSGRRSSFVSLRKKSLLDAVAVALYLPLLIFHFFNYAKNQLLSMGSLMHISIIHKYIHIPLWKNNMSMKIHNTYLYTKE